MKEKTFQIFPGMSLGSSSNFFIKEIEINNRRQEKNLFLDKFFSTLVATIFEEIFFRASIFFFLVARPSALPLGFPNGYKHLGGFSLIRLDDLQMAADEAMRAR